MRFEGILKEWNDKRGFGRIESSQGGEPIFVHVSAWPKGAARPILNQPVTFEVESSHKGKRARNIQLVPISRPRKQKQREIPVKRGAATLFAIPIFLVIYTGLSFLWRVPIWVAGIYAVASAIAFIAYAADKSAATSGNWRTPESTLHMLSLAGGWPGALLAQQILRHKSSKQDFRQIYWGTVALNIIALMVLASPAGQKLLV